MCSPPQLDTRETESGCVGVGGGGAAPQVNRKFGGGAVPSSLLPCRSPFCPGGYPSVCGGGRVQDCVEEEKEAAVSS